MQNQFAYFMRAALHKAQEGLDNGELPIGAVIVLNNEIIAAAHTMERSEGRLLVHAELLALEAADKLKPFPGNRRDVQLFTTSEPCLMCLGAAMSFFVGEIYYGHEVPSDGAVGLIRSWQRDQAAFPSYRVPKIIGGILREDAIALFKAYVARHSSGACGSGQRRSPDYDTTVYHVLTLWARLPPNRRLQRTALRAREIRAFLKALFSSTVFSIY